MCIYSMVHDWASKFPTDWWNRQRYDDYIDLTRRLKEVDDKLNLPDCNPNKGEFLDEIKQRLDAIEKRVGIKKSAKRKQPRPRA